MHGSLGLGVQMPLCTSPGYDTGRENRLMWSHRYYYKNGRKQVPGQLSVSLRKLSDFDREGKIARPENVDNAIIPEFCVEAEFLEKPGVAASSYSGLDS